MIYRRGERSKIKSILKKKKPVKKDIVGILNSNVHEILNLDERKKSIILEFAKLRKDRKRIIIWEYLLRQLNIETICEVGVRSGNNLEALRKGSPLHLVGVDSWINDGVISRNGGNYSQDKLNGLYDYVCKRFACFENISILRNYSCDAAKFLPDDYFDLIYIDADHTESGCWDDIISYFPKVKVGGILSGDDYVKKTTRDGVQFGVIEAVNRFVKKNHLEDVFYTFLGYEWFIIKDRSY